MVTNLALLLHDLMTELLSRLGHQEMKELPGRRDTSEYMGILVVLGLR